MTIPAEVLSFINRHPKFRGKDVDIQESPYFSNVRFAATVAAGPPVVLTVDTSQRVAFGYGVGGDMAPAGRAGVLATPADTNIRLAGQTRDQADVFIFGMAVGIQPNNPEPELVKAILRETDITIQTKSDMIIPAGKIPHYPQAGGLKGALMSAARVPKLDTAGAGAEMGDGVVCHFATNGEPHAGSFRKFQTPILWMAQSTGPDSNLQIVLQPQRTITVTCALARAAAAGILAYTPPTAAFADFEVTLFGAAVKVRGVNAG